MEPRRRNPLRRYPTAVRMSCTSRHAICQTCQMLWTTEGPDRWVLGVWSTSSPEFATPRFTASGLDLALTPRAGQ